MSKKDEKVEQPLRFVTPEEFTKIIEAHNKWLESGGKEGERANLSNTDFHDRSLQGVILRKAVLEKINLRRALLGGSDLSDANLIEAKLQDATLDNVNLNGADLRGAHLEEAYLGGAKLKFTNLSGAYLKQARLPGADVLGTIFRDADLQDASLEKVIGLETGQLGDANLTGAKLPEAIKKFEGLKTVEELSKNARKLFVTMLLGCVYSWLTIATTRDVNLITNSASSPLPIIQTAIPIIGFYLVAPLLLLCLYIYFHLYLQRLWEGLAGLPAVFPDGEPLNKKIYPWLFNSLVCAYFMRLNNNRPSLFRLQWFLTVLLAWYLVPITLFLFWLRCLPRHHWPYTIEHVILLAGSITIALILFDLAKATLRGDFRKSISLKKMLLKVSTYMDVVGIILIFGLLVTCFSLFSYGSINSTPLNIEVSKTSPLGRTITYVIDDQKPKDQKKAIQHFFNVAKFGFYSFAELQGEDISVKPVNWTGQSNDEITLVKGARLRYQDLRFAIASNAFLVKADLIETNFQGAILLWADLRRANMYKSNLQGTHLEEANMEEANLVEADLRGAYLQEANLKEANLARADLRGADLTDAKSLTKEQIESAIIDKDTKLPDNIKISMQEKPKKERNSSTNFGPGKGIVGGPGPGGIIRESPK